MQGPLLIPDYTLSPEQREMFGNWVFFNRCIRHQLVCVEPLIPETCDHSPGKCNRCWTNVGRDLDGISAIPFPNWTERQVKKAKIYDVVHKNVNDEGFFTHPKEVLGVHGGEDIAWDTMIDKEVSYSYMWYTP
jgi:hypothetical protein